MGAKSKLFTQKEVNKIFGHIPAKTLRWWGIRQLYGWASESADGRGVHREYGLDNLYQIGIIQELSALNIPTDVIKRIIDKNFSSGLRISKPIIVDRQEKTSAAKVADQMKKTLVITKTFLGFALKAFKKETAVFSWDSSLVERNEIKFSGPVPDFLKAIMIILDLRLIKEFVDAAIREA